MYLRATNDPPCVAHMRKAESISGHLVHSAYEQQYNLKIEYSHLSLIAYLPLGIPSLIEYEIGPPTSFPAKNNSI